MDEKRLREALTWAVGFIRCNLPQTAAAYPDMRNAEELIADAGLYAGEFQRWVARAELAEDEARRLRDQVVAMGDRICGLVELLSRRADRPVNPPPAPGV